MPASAARKPARALELERLGDDADGQDAFLAGGARDHRGSAGAGAAAHAGGDERHVAADEMSLDVGHRLLGGGGADLGLRACAESFGDVGSHLNAALGGRARQGLRVGVGDDELDALQTAFDHVVDGIAARPADTEYGDARLEFGEIRNSEIDRHGACSVPSFVSARLASALPRDAPFEPSAIKNCPVSSRRPWRNSRCRYARSAARRDRTSLSSPRAQCSNRPIAAEKSGRLPPRPAGRSSRAGGRAARGARTCWRQARQAGELAAAAGQHELLRDLGGEPPSASRRRIRSRISSMRGRMMTASCALVIWFKLGCGMPVTAG